VRRASHTMVDWLGEIANAMAARSEHRLRDEDREEEARRRPVIPFGTGAKAVRWVIRIASLTTMDRVLRISQISLVSCRQLDRKHLPLRRRAPR
jgi:hypothetical protein